MMAILVIFGIGSLLLNMVTLTFLILPRKEFLPA
jgi:hypothetical protein